jgi:cell division protein FtsW
MKSLLKIIGVVAGLGILSVVLVPHRMSRVATFMGQGNEAADYHINQAMIALGSGGLTGRGLGQSVQAYGWLPEAIHDSIFAVIGESLGFIGTLVVICAFAFLLRIIIKKVDFTENMYLRLILAGVFGWVAAHVVLNIGAMTHMIPLTGITLPLVSLGGTSLMFIMLSLGLVFAISRYTTHRKVKAEGGDADENSLGRRRVGRTRYASHSSR